MSQSITSTSASGSEIHQNSLIVAEQKPETSEAANAGQQADKPRVQQASNTSEFDQGSVKDKKSKACLVSEPTEPGHLTS
ncbi:hypothetical protein EZMO1_0053 [Endozoicomonas montiporae CL-33]|uniref:Uncharacterized protein n=1 Tax=Endozoicomonas montiporae CL-33 TaxID=570277 RepID=A0A142B6F0_9GAMM|nr:hypothetical protein [Endozoicomonas montiporae]AMO54326.1 hypothetical protein EZMO1_0053 [Endozoicomonas montiporae CL-33]